MKWCRLSVHYHMVMMLQALRYLTNGFLSMYVCIVRACLCEQTNDITLLTYMFMSSWCCSRGSNAHPSPQVPFLPTYFRRLLLPVTGKAGLMILTRNAYHTNAMYAAYCIHWAQRYVCIDDTSLHQNPPNKFFSEDCRIPPLMFDVLQSNLAYAKCSFCSRAYFYIILPNRHPHPTRLIWSSFGPLKLQPPQARKSRAWLIDDKATSIDSKISDNFDLTSTDFGPLQLCSPK